MNILYITNSRIPTEKAHGLQIMKTIEAFLLVGISVELVAPIRRNYITDTLQEFYHLKALPKITWIPNYVGILESIWHRGYFSLQRFFFGIHAFFVGLISSANIIYSRELLICFFLSLCGKRVIFEDHEPKKRFRSLYLYLVKKIPYKVLVAEQLTSLYALANISPHSYVVAPNGVDVEEFISVFRDKTVWKELFSFSLDKPIVLYAGHFYRWKGVYTLIDAAPFIDAHVCLVGGTKKDIDAIKTYVESKGITNVYIHPFLPHHDIIKFIRSADVLVLPNTAEEERSASYTTPIKLFEYMVSDVPIVASNIPSFSSYLTHKNNALLFFPDNAHDLASMVNVAIQDQSYGKKLAQQAMKIGLTFSWNNRVNHIISFVS